MNPDLDLVLERELAVPPALVWRCWTEPELLKQWFCPAPWKVVEAEMDVRPGGIFRTVMEGPDGTRMEEPAGCFLLVEPEEHLVFTDGFGPGFRPRGTTFMVADVTFAATTTGCAYRALAMHPDSATRAKHDAMGFFDGWGAAANQLESLARTLMG